MKNIYLWSRIKLHGTNTFYVIVVNMCSQVCALSYTPCNIISFGLRVNKNRKVSIMFRSYILLNFNKNEIHIFYRPFECTQLAKPLCNLFNTILINCSLVTVILVYLVSQVAIMCSFLWVELRGSHQDISFFGSKFRKRFLS